MHERHPPDDLKLIMRVMLKRLDLVTGTLAREIAGARDAGTGTRDTGTGTREIAGAVAHEVAAEGGTMRLNANVKLEDIIIWVDCYCCPLI